MKKNKGYTLIEVIIVITIMAILAGMAVVTLTIINKAKYNAAASSLENQMSSLWVKTKAISQSVKQTSPSDTSDNATVYPLCMNIKHEDNKTFSMILGYDGVGSFIEKKDKDTGETQIEETLPKIITIVYTPSESTQKASFADENNLIIEYNKVDGSVKYGAGTYEIKFNNDVVATVVLDKTTGKHYIK